MKLAVISFFALSLMAQTTVYLRDGSSPPVKITGAVTNGNYIRLTAESHGLSVGDRVTVQGVRGCAHANGTRYVAAVPGNDTVDLLARDGVTALDCEAEFVAVGVWTDAGTSDSYLGKLVPYKLKAQPNIDGFDGFTGSYTTDLSSRAVGSNLPWVAVKARADMDLSDASTENANQVGVLATVWHALGRSSSSPYLAKLKDWLNTAHLIYLNSGCDEGQRSCGRGGGRNGIDQMETQLWSVALGFSLAQDQLTDDERKAFVDKILNDRALNNSGETGCTNAYTSGSSIGTLTAVKGNNYVTISPAAGAASLQAGDLLDWRYQGSSAMLNGTYVVSSVNSDTGVVTLTAALAASGSLDPTVTATANWFYVRDYLNWNSGRCGYVWMQKHYSANPPLVPVYSGTPPAPYPTDAATGSPNNNLLLWRLRVYLELGAATCGVRVPGGTDVRGCELFEQAEAYYWDQARPYGKSLFSGPTSAGSGIYRHRVEGALAAMALTLKNGLTSPLDSTSGTWFQRDLMMWVFQLLPGSGKYLHGYGERSDNYMTMYQTQCFLPALIAASEGSAEAEYARWQLYNKYSEWTSGKLNGSSSESWASPRAFLHVDPTAAATDYTSAIPPQYIWWTTDLDTTWTGLNAPGGLLAAASRTGWGASDTSVFTAPLGVFLDHTSYQHIGHYQIYKGNWLLGNASSYSIADCNGSSDISCWHSPGESDFAVEIGRASSATATGYIPVSSAIPLLTGWASPGSYGVQDVAWAGAHPGGRKSNDYAYLAFDSALSAKATSAVNYQRYHLLHLKKDGRDYLLRYVSTSLGSALPMRTYLHFPNNGEASEGNTYAGSDGVIYSTTNSSTSMHSRVLLPMTLSQTDVHVVRSSSTELVVNANASADYPVRFQIGGVSCSYTSSASIAWSSLVGNAYIWVRPSDCAIVVGAPSGVSTGTGLESQTAAAFPSSDYYPIAVWPATALGWGTAPYVQSALPHTQVRHERRYAIDLGTGATSEFMVLHAIHGSLGDAMPDAALVTSASNWRTVQIGGPLPSVAAFNTQGRCQTDWSATTTHSGTAQYVVAGLCTGNYAASLNGVAQASVTVAAGDESATFDGAPGSWSLSLQSTTTPLSITQTSLPQGTAGQAYSVTLTASGGVEPYSWTVTDGSLCAGLELSSSGVLQGTPAASGLCGFTVRVTDASSTTADKSFQISVIATLSISDETPPHGVANSGYWYELIGSGGTLPYSWQLSGGLLPSGLQMSTEGEIFGTPTTAGTSNFMVTLADATSLQVSRLLSLTVEPDDSFGLPGIQEIISSPDRVAIRYHNAASLDSPSCALSIWPAGSPSDVVESVTQAASNTWSQHVFGDTTPLQAGVQYTAGIQCGAAQASVLVTTATAQSAVGVPVTVGQRSGRVISSMRVDYGQTSSLGSSLLGKCDGLHCTAVVPAYTPGLFYMRLTLIDSSSKEQTQQRASLIPVRP